MLSNSDKSLCKSFDLKKPEPDNKSHTSISFKYAILTFILSALMINLFIVYDRCDRSNDHDDFSCYDLFIVRVVAPQFIYYQLYLPYFISQWGLGDFHSLVRSSIEYWITNKTNHIPEIVNKPIHFHQINCSGIMTYVYTPEGQITNDNNYPAFIYFHGGGGVSGNPKSYDPGMRLIANMTGMRVFAPNYRKSPEVLFPIPEEDCFSVAKYIFENSNQLGVDSKRIVLGGDSFGASVSLSIAFKWKEFRLYEKYEPILALALTYPIMQCFNFLSVIDKFYAQYALTPRVCTSFISLHISGNFDIQPFVENSSLALMSTNYSEIKTRFPLYFPDIAWQPPDYLREKFSKYADAILHPHASLILQPDFSNLPYTFVASAEYDILFPDSQLLIQRLKQDGVKYKFIVYEKMFHGFIGFSLRHDTILPTTLKFYLDLADFVKEFI